MFSVWYLDDGTIVGSRSAILEFLSQVEILGSPLGLFLNKQKCELFWPSGDQSFLDFPLELRRPSDGLDLLCSLVWGSDNFFDSYFASKVDRTRRLQELLCFLEDPQCEFHLLRSCLNVCKVTHLLCTVPPNRATHQLHNFDIGLRQALEKIIRCSISDRTWSQATLPSRFGGLGLRCSVRTAPAAFLASCCSSLSIVTALLNRFNEGNRVSTTCIPGEAEARNCPQHLLPDWSIPDSPSQHSLQDALDHHQFHLLFNTSSIRDRAHLNSLHSSKFTGAWLQAIPNPNLGLSLIASEFICALRYWLSIPFFDSSRCCSCNLTLDPHGDHLLGCGHGPLRIRRHDALCHIVFQALLQDNSQVKREQHFSAILLHNQVTFSTQTLQMVVLHILTVTACNQSF